MADNIKLVQSQEFRLAIGANTGATSIRVSNLKDVDGNVLTMTDFGTKGFGTLEPNTSREEAIVFTGITDNSDTTYTLTGVSNVITKAPYTEASGTTKTHTGGAVFIISDNPGLLTTFANKDNDETINQTWTYSVPNYPKIDTPGTEPTDDAQFIPKKYADDNKIDKDGTLAMAADLNMDSNKITNLTTPTANSDGANKSYVDGVAIAGAPDANTTTKGIVELATDAEFDAGAATGSTSASLFATPEQIQERGLTIGYTAGEDLTDGMPVGLGLDGTVARAVRAYANDSTTPPSDIDNAVIIHIIAVDTNKYVAAYVAATGTSFLKIVAFTYDSSTFDITFGSSYTVTGNAETAENGMCKLDTNKFVVCSTTDGSNNANYSIFSLSGTTITRDSTGTLYNSGSLTTAQCCQLDTDKFAFFYAAQDSNATYMGFATVSGSTPTVVDSSTGIITNFSNAEYISMTKIATDKFAMSSSDGYALVCTTSSSTLTIGTKVLINTPGGVAPVTIVSAVDNTFWASFRSGVVYCTVSTTTITEVAEIATSNFINEDLFLDGTDVLQIYNSSGTAESGLFKLTISGTISRTKLIPLTLGTATYRVSGFSDGSVYAIIGGVASASEIEFHLQGMSATFVGFAQSTVSSGDSVRISDTYDNAQSGLTAGVMYKILNGDLSSTFDSTEPYKVQAVSATEVKVI